MAMSSVKDLLTVAATENFSKSLPCLKSAGKNLMVMNSMNGSVSIKWKL